MLLLTVCLRGSILVIVEGSLHLFLFNLKGNSAWKNVGLNEYLREMKFCTGQESVDVVQRKKIFNDKNYYLFTYLKNCVLREDGSSYCRYYIYIYATSAFSTTVCILRSSVMRHLPFGLSRVSSQVWQHTHSDDVGIGQQHAH